MGVGHGPGGCSGPGMRLKGKEGAEEWASRSSVNTQAVLGTTLIGIE